MKTPPALLLTLLATAAQQTTAEFRRFEGQINAASNYIHYSEGYVVTPGYVDISSLVFTNADGGSAKKIFSGKTRGDPVSEWTDDDESNLEDEDFNEDDGGVRQRFLDGGDVVEGEDIETSFASGSTVSSSIVVACKVFLLTCILLYHISLQCLTKSFIFMSLLLI